MQERQAWAVDQLLCAAKASQRMGLTAHATFSGALAWPFFYPWPQRPAGLVEEAFAELGRRWLPILNAFEDAGVDACYELHPGEDLHDGVTFERFLDAVGGHKRANILYDPSHMILQQLDYLEFLDIYHERVRAFHVKDAEYRPSGRSGVYGGYQPWIDRAGRFRSLGDGQIDFNAIFSKMAQYDFPGWAVLEWECCLKHPEDGAAEGAKFIQEKIIRVTEKAFDDFAGGGADAAKNKKGAGAEVAALHRLPGCFNTDRNLVFDGNCEERGGIDLEVRAGGGYCAGDRDIFGICRLLKGDVIVVDGLPGKLHFEIGVDGSRRRRSFGQPCADNDHGELRAAGYLNHVQIAIAVAGVEAVDGRRDEKIALPVMACAFALCCMAYAVHLMHGVRHVVAQRRPLKDPLGAGL
jgi:sugar phosphate isomerase/epimerase